MLSGGGSHGVRWRVLRILASGGRAETALIPPVGYKLLKDNEEGRTTILDPTKVMRTVLQNAASIAGLMITTECVIAGKPEDDKKMGGGMPGGMGGGDMY